MSGKIVDGMCKRDGLTCSKVDEDRCIAYAFPSARFRVGGCALCSIPAKKSASTKQTVNALKASKRAARGN